MAENLTSAKCSIEEYEAARAAGLLVVTTADERAIHSFAQLIRANDAARVGRINALRERVNEQLNAAYALIGRFELTEKPELQTQAQALFADVRAMILEFRNSP